jgi:hypothetical protein
MKKVEYFISERSKDRFFWNKIYELLEEKNIPIHTEPKDCDISVVLGGPLVNPLPLKGKKVLAFKSDEWKVVKWEVVYEPILQEYYDHMINTTGLNPEETLRSIEEECQELA